MKSRTLTTFIIIVVVSLVGAFGCYHFFNVIKNNVELSYQTQAVADAQVEKDQQIKNAKSVLDEIGPSVQSLSSRLVNTEGTIKIIESLESIGKSIGAPVTINSVGVSGFGSKSKDKNQATENLTMSVGVTGSWNKVYNFLKIIENLPYKTTIQTVSLTHNLSDKNSVWNASFSINILKNK